MKKAQKPEFMRIENGADVISALEKLPGISETARRDMLSDVRCLANTFSVSPADLPISRFQLRLKFAKLHPVLLGISAKRLSNMKSNFKRAVVHALRLASPPETTKSQTSKSPPTPEWEALGATIQPDWRRWTLSRFMRHCCERGVAPHEVCDDVFAVFVAEIERSEITKDPAQVILKTIQAWNGFLKESGNNYQQLTPPPRVGVQTPGLETYPKSFTEDLGRYVARLSMEWPEDWQNGEMSGPAKPLKPVSIRNIVSSVRKACFALIETGTAPGAIIDLNVLVDRESFDRILKFYWLREPGIKPVWVRGLAGHLLAIAKFHVQLDASELAILKALRAKVSKEPIGFSEKNALRLAQFDDPENVERLFSLPHQILRRANKVSSPSSRTAGAVMRAVALAILNCTVVRIKNVASIHLERNFIWTSAGKARTLQIFFPANEIKNTAQFLAPVPPEITTQIECYIKTWRPLLPNAQSQWLFPSRRGHKSPDKFGAAISDFVWKETGLLYYPHLTRHIAMDLFLNQQPDNLAMASQILAHRKIDTTRRFYSGMRTKQALQRYQQTVLAPVVKKRRA